MMTPIRSLDLSFVLERRCNHRGDGKACAGLLAKTTAASVRCCKEGAMANEHTPMLPPFRNDALVSGTSRPVAGHQPNGKCP